MEQNLQVSTYDIQNEPLVFSKHLMDTLLSLPQPSDSISLFCFYYYTAKWQRTNQIKATTDYTSKGLHWSETRVRKVKKTLLRLGLVKDIVTCDKQNRITGHYVWVNLVPDIKLRSSSENPIKPPPSQKPTVKPFHTVRPLETNAYNKNNNKMLLREENNKMLMHEKIVHDSKVIPPSLEMVQTYCNQRKNSVDPVQFMDFYESKGWLVGKNKMKDWQASIRTWERNDYSSSSTSGKPKLPKTIQDYGITWTLYESTGKYYDDEGRLYRK